MAGLLNKINNKDLITDEVIARDLLVLEKRPLEIILWPLQKQLVLKYTKF
ncbi:hypothetical protein SAMN05192559_11450 [Halobacillus karajensis]|nr:hypothetical protein [Halobacillus karajensis]SEI12099.1 hypothetical protein SAMN05192559_11450 [Halobacillus karajensis]